MSKLYSLSFVREGLPPVHYVSIEDQAQWSTDPDGLIIYQDFGKLMDEINELIEDYRNPDLYYSDKRLIGTIRNKEEDEARNFLHADSLIAAMIEVTPFGAVIRTEGQLTTNEVEIKAVMHTSY